MGSRLPTVFISSTFYDLRQVRANIAQFVQDELRYTFLASEYPSFPVDPTLAAIENCRRRVENDADIFVLVVGARYGSTVPSGSRSVTNIEYLAARAKAIPIYAFITREVIGLVKLLEKNPNLDLSGSVDSPMLFDFVRELRGANGVWTFEFDLAQEIISTLSVQFAYQMSRGLDVLARLRSSDEVLRTLNGEPFRLVVERPNGWVPNLLIELVQLEFDAARELRRDHDLGITLGVGEQLTHDTAYAWSSSILTEATRIVHAMRAFINDSMNGLSKGEPAEIVYATRQIGRMYREALEWAARVRRVHAPMEWQPAFKELGSLMSEFFVECDAFVPRMRKQVADAMASPGPRPVLFNFSFMFRIPLMNAYFDELKKIASRRGVSSP